MPVPFLLLGAAALIGGGGVVAGVGGLNDQKEAKRIVGAAAARGRAVNERLRLASEKTDRRIAADAARREALVAGPHRRFGELVQALHARGVAVNLVCLDGVTVTPARVASATGVSLSAGAVAGGLAQGSLAGATAGAATFGAVGALGTASTNVAIAGLSGAAAKSATLAWLGGGSLASGGGGVALGTTVLGGIVAAPVLLFGGLALANAGEKALTKAHEHSAHVDRECKRVEVAIGLLGDVRARVAALGEVLDVLGAQLTAALDGLDARRFDPRDPRHARRLAVATTLWSALDEVLRTPAFDEAGKATLESAEVVLRMRELIRRGVA